MRSSFTPRRSRPDVFLTTLLTVVACGPAGTGSGAAFVEDDDLVAQAGPSDPSLLHPVERVPRAAFGDVGPPPLTAADLTGLVYPSANAEERASLMAGLAFFTTEHTSAEGLGPEANQKFCLGCHRNADEAADVALFTTSSQVARAARASPTNFAVTGFDPTTGGGHAADDVNAVSGPGHTAAFTIFGDYSPSKNTYDDLARIGGFVQHTRPSLPACLPDPLPQTSVDPDLQGGVDPTTHLSPTGYRRTVAERAGPPYIGRGLIEAIYADDIVKNEDPQDRLDHVSSLRGNPTHRFPECTGDCIAGHHNENTSNQAFVGGETTPRVGRFGLRAAGPTILQFVVGGVNGELGFTSPFKPAKAATSLANLGRAGCEAPDTNASEVSSSTVLSLRQLIRMTAPPEFGDTLLGLLRAPDPAAPAAAGTPTASVQRGAVLFGVDLRGFANRTIAGRMPRGGDGLDPNAILQADRGLNCVGCHTPVQPTGLSPAREGGRLLSNVWAPIFSDVLLHRGPEVTPERIASTPRNPVVVSRGGTSAFDISRNFAEDALPNQGVATGRDFRTAPLMGLGRVGPPFLHDARVYLSSLSSSAMPASTVFSDRTVTNAPLIVHTVDDAIRAAIELHDLPAPDDGGTPPGGGCPLPAAAVGDVTYAGAEDLCPPYDSAGSMDRRSEARETIREYRALPAPDQQALIDFLKEL